jgi:signal transduction histidine kinase
MTEIPRASMGGAATPIGRFRRRARRLPVGPRGEGVVVAVAVAAAAAAVWITVQAHFIAHPGWTAVLKANLVLAPVLVGIYWRRRRPHSRFGPMVIGLGLICIPYILQSSPRPALFGLGVAWKLVIYLALLAVILAFPSGRLERLPERVALGAAALLVVLPGLAVVLVSPRLGSAGAISGCTPACPANGLALGAAPSAASTLSDVARAGFLAVAVAAVSLIMWRFVSGSPPRRRALAVGAPLAILFLCVQAIYQALVLIDPHAGGSHQAIRWTFAVAASLLSYGWLLALVAAELFAARVLRSIVGESLRPPSPMELEAMLRRPLSDPNLRLAFWNPVAGSWTDSGGVIVAPPQPAADQKVIEFELDREPAVAIVHQAELAEDPELLEAAGAVALLAHENADLEAAWNESLRELAESRARIAAATDAERRKLERDLHDGAQQRLLAVLLKLDLVAELASDDGAIRERLVELEEELEAAIDELRQLGHGIYPTVLANSGLAGALSAVAARSAGRITFTDEHVAPLPSEIEAALYYCCLEAVQNATKHAGPRATIAIRLRHEAGEARLRIADNGRGFQTACLHAGMGLRNMQDRLGAVQGRVEISSTPARGTTVTAAVPLNR